MAVILGISLTLFICAPASLLKLSATFSPPLHKLCLESIPTGSYREGYSAIVCATPLPPGLFRSDLATSGLLHLVVVSGSHLIFLLTFLETLGSKWRWFNIGVLVVYALMTQFQPPVVRSLFGVVLQELNQRARLNWRSPQVTLLAGVLVLGFEPSWIRSYSFLLSWSASLALSLTEVYKVHGILRHVLIFLFLFPVLSPLISPHPISIFYNWLLSPLLGFVLFPASLLATLFHFLTPMTDCLWWGLQQAVSYSRLMISPVATSSLSFSYLGLWIYLWSTHFIISQILPIWLRQRRK